MLGQSRINSFHKIQAHNTDCLDLILLFDILMISPVINHLARFSSNSGLKVSREDSLVSNFSLSTVDPVLKKV